MKNELGELDYPPEEIDTLKPLYAQYVFCLHLLSIDRFWPMGFPTKPGRRARAKWLKNAKKKKKESDKKEQPKHWMRCRAWRRTRLRRTATLGLWRLTEALPIPSSRLEVMAHWTLHSQEALQTSRPWWSWMLGQAILVLMEMAIAMVKIRRQWSWSVQVWAGLRNLFVGYELFFLWNNNNEFVEERASTEECCLWIFSTRSTLRKSLLTSGKVFPVWKSQDFSLYWIFQREPPIKKNEVWKKFEVFVIFIFLWN